MLIAAVPRDEKCRPGLEPEPPACWPLQKGTRQRRKVPSICHPYLVHRLCQYG
jgi:hypothetical protein